jgi:hypothetical protein
VAITVFRIYKNWSPLSHSWLQKNMKYASFPNLAPSLINFFLCLALSVFACQKYTLTVLLIVTLFRDVPTAERYQVGAGLLKSLGPLHSKMLLDNGGLKIRFSELFRPQFFTTFLNISGPPLGKLGHPSLTFLWGCYNPPLPPTHTHTPVVMTLTLFHTCFIYYWYLL